MRWDKSLLIHIFASNNGFILRNLFQIVPTLYQKCNSNSYDFVQTINCKNDVPILKVFYNIADADIGSLSEIKVKFTK